MKLKDLFEAKKTNQEIANELGIHVDEVNKLKPSEIKTILKVLGKHDFVSLSKFSQKEYKMGLKVEMEHCSNPLVAALIVKDHLSEPGAEEYYSNLEKMEKDEKKVK
jgi:hypothetical protein